MARSKVSIRTQVITAKLPPAHVAEESIRPGEWHPFAVRNSALRYFDKDGKRASRHWMGHADGRNRRIIPKPALALPVHPGPARRARLALCRAGDPLCAVAGRRAVPDGGVLLG